MAGAYLARMPFLPRGSGGDVRSGQGGHGWSCSYLAASLARVDDIILVDGRLWIASGRVHGAVGCGRGRGRGRRAWQRRWRARGGGVWEGGGEANKAAGSRTVGMGGRAVGQEGRRLSALLAQ